MNRRKFTAASVALAAAIPGAITVRAQQRRPIISEMTGAEIDISNTSFVLRDQRVIEDDGYSFEVIVFENDVSQVAIQFLTGPERPTPTGADEESVSWFEQEFGRGNVELVGGEVLEDGDWSAFRVMTDEGGTLLVYNELQLNAFPDFDLTIQVRSNESDIDDVLAEVQRIDVAGGPPMLFTEESRVEDDLFVVATSGTDRSGRPVNGTRNRRSSSGQAGTTASGDDEVIQAVRDHQSKFHDELDSLDSILSRIQNSPDLESEAISIFSELDDLANAWIPYADDAADLAFSASLASLEAVYREWAEAITTMGFALAVWVATTVNLDGFLDALDAVYALDMELVALLGSLGVSSSPGNHRSTLPDGLPDRAVAMSRIAMINAA